MKRAKASALSAVKLRGSATPLPFAQALFYWSLYFSGPHTQNLVWDNFIAPFYKTFEGILYVSFLFTYLALAYRYVKYKQAVVRRKGSFWEYSKTVWL